MRQLLALLMAIAFVASTSVGSTDQNGVTTPAIDTTGANLLTAVVADYTVATLNTVTDSKGNTWTARTSYALAGDQRVTIWYAKNPTVGSGHTFSYGGTTILPSLMVAAFSGADTTSPYTLENGSAPAGGVTSRASGTVTPAEDGDLLIAGLALDSVISNLSISSPFTIQETQATNPAKAFGGGLAYSIQTTATARNPTWSWTTSSAAGADVAVFKAAAAATASLFRPSLLVSQAVNRAATY